jgi:hypothetical protein
MVVPNPWSSLCIVLPVLADDIIKALQYFAEIELINSTPVDN